MKKLLSSTLCNTSDFFKLHQNIYILILSLGIGVLGGYGAIIFRYLINLVQTISITGGENIIDALRATPWYILLVIPMLGGFLVGPLIYFFAREAKGHGVPEVMEAVALRGGRIRFRVVIVKCLASAITIGTGGSVGREGPIVQIGSAIGSAVGQWLCLTPQRIKTLVACGAAAGIAATFNAPIAGVLFSVEIILGNFAIHTFSPIVVSSVISTVISHYHLGNHPAFHIPQYMLKSAWELILYLALGIVIAIIGILFMRSVEWQENFFSGLKLPDYLKTPLGLLGLGIMIVFFPHIYGNGYETITLTLHGNLTLLMLLALIPIKIFATSLTLGAGGSGGIFAPSLFIGATAGGAFGHIAHRLFPGVAASSGAYALVGMAALVGAVTHAPVTAIIILFELTGDYKIIIPLMFSCIIATLITSSLQKDSIYTAKLSRRGVNLNVGLESTIMKRNLVRDIMQVNVRTIDPDMPFSNLFNFMLNNRGEHLYVVGMDRIYLGEVCFHHVSKMLQKEGIHARRRAIDVMNHAYPIVSPDESLMRCVHLFGMAGVEELPVVNPETREFMGIITYRDLFNLYNREILREGSLGLKFVTRSEEEPRSDYVNIPEGYTVELCPVVNRLVGVSVKELDLRNRYDVNIVAVRSAAGGEGDSEIPAPDRVLTRQDVLVVIGLKENLNRLRRELT
ncbi:chloride channel protein [bacterium]|nr:chloride channel protein [candidate division CSSED10-310 bacterium]